MDDKVIVGSAIGKIKQQEENKEANLKVKRENEAEVAAEERSIRETLVQIDEYKQEHDELIKKTDELRVQLFKQKIRRDALSAQLTASNKELVELKAKLDEKYSEVQDLRSNYLKEVQDVSKKCDIWALLTKPVSTEIRYVKKPLKNTDQAMQNEKRLKSARERQDKARAERERLMAEPNAGKQFVRIRNALRYSMEMTTNLQK